MAQHGRCGNWEGTIRQRADGRREVRITITADGKSQSKSAYSKTRKEVQAKMQAVRCEAERDLASSGTVAEHFSEWLAEVKARREANTHRTYGNLAKNHIPPNSVRSS